ncbi:SusC/RagA family TonB-linked outer membrane protein [Fulvivirga sedimenti]|uniref:SusC/RagA family TonB-linked outer membrane protein n=1 Tax=Fulvivirga sedimenti TaxID=2879465 RepID=A0A9X1HVY7_9BACT|nr:SusC/RagA family TonB-linked outer membrane protein [Fulvivirga sedimenti]MCA6078930.1 SusC/RagA family TonB-linked outer membrane protein [Fulvivirga sedimenti]
MKRIKLLFFLLLFLNSIVVFGQQSISGKVVDNNNAALPGVTVLEVGTTNGTVTDVNGNYTLTLTKSNASVSFNYLGFVGVTMEVGNKTEINVTMEEDITQLSEVVVTALGFEANNDRLAYANSVVSEDAIVKSGESTIINSLQGKASGVRISRNSGDPGAGAYIQIRGISTIDRDAQPLIVVDGIPLSNDSRGAQETYAAQSRLNDINPNDIESVNVLKGASAAALWGTRALGGVIYIKTKSGNYNQKLQVKYRASYSIDQINRRYPMQSSFGQGDNGVYNARARDSWGDKIADRSGGPDEFDTSGQFYIDQDGNTYYPIISKNSRETYNDQNFDKIFQNGHFLENNISVNGGNAQSTFFASFSDFNQEGIVRNNSDYRRTTARVNVTHNLTDKIQIKSNTTYGKTVSNRIRRGASSSGLMLGLLRNAPDFDITGYRGDYYASGTSAPVPNRQRSYREPLGADGTPTYNNPLWAINEQENIVDVNRFVTSLELTISPTSWLDLIGRVGVDTYTESTQNFVTPGSASTDLITGLFERNLARNTIFNMDYIAKASTKFNDNFSGSFLLGFNYNNRELLTEGAEITNFLVFTDVASGLRDIDNALPENRDVTSTFGEERTVGIYSSADFSAYDMFYLNGTLRAEYASTFGDNSDKPFFFPSVSLAWQFSQLEALKNNRVFSFGKFRVSYGEVGVQPRRYNTTNTFISPTFSDNLGGQLDGGLFGNGAFIPSSRRGSASLKPERKKEFEAGVDLRFLENKLSLSATAFWNRTEDILLDFPIANSRGVTALYTNGAEMENKGLEIDLNYKVLNTKDWKWDIGVIYSDVKNKVTKLDSTLNIDLGGLASASARALEGYPLGVLVGGRILRDDQGNIVYDQNGFPEQDLTNGVIADPNPDWQGSVYSTISYKNFSLSVLFETLQGADIYAGTKAVMLDLGTWGPSARETTASQNLLDFNGNLIPAGTTFRGSVENFGAGPVAATEAWYNADGGFFGGGNDELFVEDGSWTRLREISLSYTARPDWLTKIGITNAQLSFTGRNLILWTEFEGNDPDTNLQGVSVARGIDYFNNPGTKSYVFTLELTF